MKILLADDELGVISSLKDLLIENGYFVDIAMSGFDVIKMHQTNKYDALIIDVDFQDGINGIEASNYVRDKDKKIKIIVITAYANTQLTRHAVLEIGGNFLIKPIEESKLIKLINE